MNEQPDEGMQQAQQEPSTSGSEESFNPNTLLEADVAFDEPDDLPGSDDQALDPELIEFQKQKEINRRKGIAVGNQKAAMAHLELICDGQGMPKHLKERVMKMAQRQTNRLVETGKYNKSAHYSAVRNAYENFTEALKLTADQAEAMKKEQQQAWGQPHSDQAAGSPKDSYTIAEWGKLPESQKNDSTAKKIEIQNPHSFF